MSGSSQPRRRAALSSGTRKSPVASIPAILKHLSKKRFVIGNLSFEIGHF
jgi:hypothetical protein